MRLRIPAILLLGTLSLACQAGQCFDYKTFMEFRQSATQSEHEGKWQNIHWLKDINQAKEQASASHKPILVFLYIGFHGEKDADDC